LLTTAKKFADKPIVFIAVNSGTTPAQVAAYAKAQKITWPIIVDTKRGFEKAAGVGQISLRNIHQCAYITADGTLRLARSADIGRTAESALQGASWRVDPSKVPESLRLAHRAIEWGKYTLAATAIGKALKSSSSDEKDAATKLNAAVLEELEKDATKAWALGKAREFYEAHLAFRTLGQRFKGYQMPEKYASAAKWLTGRKEVQDELKADKILEAAKKLLASPKKSIRKRVPRRLKGIIKNFPDTRAAEEAQAILEKAG